MTEITEFQVRKDNLSKHQIKTRVVDALGDGEILAKVDHFAFTANNVTYGVVGERIGYWKFFPTAEEGWGIIPVWGFADVIESNASDIAVGERLYGYWPMATHLVMAPTKVRDTRMIDGVAHRAELPPVYNAYARVKQEPGYDGTFDDDRMALYPLYATSYCLFDFFNDNDLFGAKQIIVPSASSKTAIGVAYAFSAEEGGPSLIGVTSGKNADFVKSLGLYDSVVTYDDLETSIDKSVPSAIIDMSGAGPIIGRLHAHLGENMRYTSNVGITHYEDAGMDDRYIAERSAMFFAPGHIQKRASDWGPGEFEKRSFEFWKNAATKSRDWLDLNIQSGPQSVTEAYTDVLSGNTSPKSAWIVSL
ncbi:MAG: DUF2855 family protein [Pseudomonadota bacterium]